MRAVPAGPGAYSPEAYVRMPSGSPVAIPCQLVMLETKPGYGLGFLRSRFGSLSLDDRPVLPGLIGDAVGLKSCHMKKHHMTIAASPSALTGRAIAMLNRRRFSFVQPFVQSDRFSAMAGCSVRYRAATFTDELSCPACRSGWVDLRCFRELCASFFPGSRALVPGN
jgi:hypothetical protein